MGIFGMFITDKYGIRVSVCFNSLLNVFSAFADLF